MFNRGTRGQVPVKVINMLYSILLSAVLLASGLVETGAAEATDTLSAVTVVADRGGVQKGHDSLHQFRISPPNAPSEFRRPHR